MPKKLGENRAEGKIQGEYKGESDSGGNEPRGEDKGNTRVKLNQWVGFVDEMGTLPGAEGTLTIIMSLTCDCCM